MKPIGGACARRSRCTPDPLRGLGESAMDSPSALLHRHGLKPKPSWGQNFLSNEEAVERIVGALAPGMNECVVELGAGLGHLTRALSAAGAQVVAVERDRDLVQVLQD